MRKVATPWSRAGSGFTLLFEAYVLALAKTMPIANAAERLGEHDTRLWRLAPAAMRLEEIREFLHGRAYCLASGYSCLIT